MTIGNVNGNLLMMSGQSIGPMDMDVSMLSQGLDLFPASKGNFGDVMNRVNENAAKISNETTKLTSSTHEETYKKATSTSDSSARVEKKTVSKEDGTQIESDVKNAIKDALEMDEEQLTQALEMLGLTVVDLLEPTNVVLLLAQVKGVEAEGIVMDADLSAMLSNAVDAITQVMESWSSELNLPMDTVVEALKEAGQKEETLVDVEHEEALDVMEEASEVNTTTIVDENTGKEITITLEHNVTTSEAVRTTGTNVNNEAKDSKNSSDSHQNEQSLKEMGTSMLNQLTDAMNETQTVTDSFSSYTNVNATQIINQILDAVKVNVTSSLQSMEIQLTPENLGKLNLTVLAKDGMITASITAQNEAVKNALETQMIALKDSLNQAGIKVESVEVTVASHEFESGMMNQNGENGSEDNAKSNARRRFRGEDELLEDETAESANESVMDANSINITA